MTISEKSGEFFLTFNEFFEHFNIFSIVYDFDHKNYRALKFEDYLAWSMFEEEKPEKSSEKREFDKPYYLLQINKQTSSKASFILDLQKEDSRLKADVSMFNAPDAKMKDVIGLCVYKCPPSKEYSKDLSQLELMVKEGTESWILGAELQNLENGAYLVVPSLVKPPINNLPIRYFLTFYTNLGEDEFTVKSLSNPSNKGISPWQSKSKESELRHHIGDIFQKIRPGIINVQSKSPELVKGTSDFYRAASLRAYRMDHTEHIIALLNTPRSAISK